MKYLWIVLLALGAIIIVEIALLLKPEPPRRRAVPLKLPPQSIFVSPAKLEKQGKWLVVYNPKTKLFERVMPGEVKQVKVQKDKDGNIISVEENGKWEESYLLKKPTEKIGPVKWSYIHPAKADHISVNGFIIGKQTVSNNLKAIIDGKVYHAKLAEFLVPLDHKGRRMARIWVWYDAVADDGDHLWNFAGLQTGKHCKKSSVAELENFFATHKREIVEVDISYDYNQEEIDSHKKMPKYHNMAIFLEAMNRQLSGGEKWGKCNQAVLKAAPGDMKHLNQRIEKIPCLQHLPTNIILGRLSKVTTSL